MVDKDTIPFDEVATFRITNPGAVRLLINMAEAEGCEPQDFIEALLHYAGSIHKRPGSWEANKPFELASYIGPDSGFADKWF